MFWKPDRTGRSDQLNQEPARYPVQPCLRNRCVKKPVLNRLNRPKTGKSVKPDRFYQFAIFFFFWKKEVQNYFWSSMMKLTTSLWQKWPKIHFDWPNKKLIHLLPFKKELGGDKYKKKWYMDIIYRSLKSKNLLL